MLSTLAMIQMMTDLRIHVSVLGFLGDRIYVPPIEMNADKVYLLRYKKEKDKKAIKALEQIKRELKKNKIDLIEQDCEIFEATEMVKKLKEIILKEKEHHLFFNISSGNTLASNALTIAAMLWQDEANSLKLYYQYYDYDKMKVGDQSLIDLSIFQIEQPTKEQQKVLKFISENPDGVSKTEILKFLYPDNTKSFTSLNKASKRKIRDDNTKNLTKLNRRVIDKLLYEWKMISITGKGKKGIVTLSDKGKNFVRFI